MKKIKVHVFSDSIGLQIFDRYYAYRQAINADNNYMADVSIEFGTPEPGAFNIAFASMPEKQFCNFDNYDLILLDNSGEPLEVASVYIADCLIRYNHVYFITGACVDQTHWLSSKIITCSHNLRLFHDIITRGFYPHYYERSLPHGNIKHDMCYINGNNRSNRQYFMELLQKQLPDIHVRAWSKNVIEVLESQFEDKYDQEFRQFVNDRYNIDPPSDSYYNNCIPMGIDQKFGDIFSGFSVLDEHYNYRCVIFPETHWTNLQYFATEKIFKCFVTGAIPWPIAGAKTHAMYNQLGYQTAWNLLPKEHQKFDNELTHVTRTDQIIQAISWLKQNSDILTSNAVQSIIQQNRLNFFANSADLTTVTQLHQAIFKKE